MLMRLKAAGAEAQLFLFDPDHTRPIQTAVEILFREHWEASGIRPRSVAEYEVTMRKFCRWASRQPRLVELAAEHRSIRPMFVLESLTTAELAGFRQWLVENGRGQNQGRARNKSREHLAAIINRLAKQNPTAQLPRVWEREAQTTAAQKVILTRAELGRIYLVAGTMTPPPSWPKKAPPFADCWQAAIVLFVVLGVDTGALFPVDPDEETALRWRNWWPEPMPPTRTSETTNQGGWLLYSRQKTSAPMQRPVNRQMAWQLRRLQQAAKSSPEALIVPAWKHSEGWRPCQIFRRLCAAAQVPAAVNARTLKPIPWQLKALRKTCSTWHNTAVPGSASAVLGHRASNLEAVTAAHYVDCDPLADRAILTTPLPAEFPT